jgi:hypothetical protein
MRKLVVPILLLFTAGAVFAGGQKDVSPTGPRTLTIATQAWVKTKTMLVPAIDAFMKAHPNVKIELVTVDKWGGPAYIPEWQAGKTSFDLFVSGTGAQFSELINGGWLDPLDDMLTGSMAKDNFVAGFLKEGAFKKPDGSGVFYPVIPFLGEVAIVGINTEIMKKAGLWQNGKPVAIPDWNDPAFLDWFRKLSPFAEQGAQVQIWDKEFIQYNYCGPILAMTGTFLDRSGKGFDVSSDAARKWLGLIQQMNKEKLGNYTVTDTAGYEAWKTGKAGSFYAAQGHTMELVLSAGKPVDAIGYVSWPGADKNGSIIWTHSVWIPKVSTNKDLARTFIREMVFSKEFQQWQFNNWGKLPVMKAAFGEGIQRYAEYMPLILSIAEHSKSLPLYKDFQAYVDILKKYLPDAASNRISVDDALAKIKAESAGLDFTDMRAN